MSPAPQSLRLESVGIAAAIVVAAVVVVRIVSAKLRGQLGPAGRRGGGSRLPPMPALDPDSQRMIKTALERGIVTSSQLAAMGPAERELLLKSLKSKLRAG